MSAYVQSAGPEGSDEKSLIQSHDPKNDNNVVEVDPTASSNLSNISSNTKLKVLYPQRRRSASPDTLSLISADDFHELRRTLSSIPTGQDGAKAEEPRSKLQAFWTRNKGMAMVIVSQLFGTLMNITTRLLELEGNNGKGMHPFQILFARMSITCLLSLLYMWWKKLPDAPFGARGIRLLLVARGTGGFFGVFGLYWSLQYLPLSDATVLTFLAPSIACYVCSKILKEPFTRAEQLGGLVSLAGVILIARPTYFFSSNTTPPTDPSIPITPRALPTADAVTPKQHLAAVGMSMVGVLGAASAFTTIRWIGKRAHPLISVNYFAAWCTLVSTIALAFVPSIPFVLPATLKEWSLLFFIGISGFVMQFMLTAGLRYEKSSRSTNMVYSQMLWALAGDEIIFGTRMSGWSLGGSALILGSAVVVALQKQGKKEKDEVGGSVVQRDEEMGLVEGLEGVGGGEEELEGGRAVEMMAMPVGEAEVVTGREVEDEEAHEGVVGR